MANMKMEVSSFVRKCLETRPKLLKALVKEEVEELICAEAETLRAPLAAGGTQHA